MSLEPEQPSITVSGNESIPGRRILVAVAATLGSFLPSVVFVAILNPVVTQLRRSAWTAAFLDGINVSAVGLMASVTVQLGQAALVAPKAWWIGLVALRWRVNAAWPALGLGF